MAFTTSSALGPSPAEISRLFDRIASATPEQLARMAVWGREMDRYYESRPRPCSHYEPPATGLGFLGGMILGMGFGGHHGGGG